MSEKIAPTVETVKFPLSDGKFSINVKGQMVNPILAYTDTADEAYTYFPRNDKYEIMVNPIIGDHKKLFVGFLGVGYRRRAINGKAQPFISTRIDVILGVIHRITKDGVYLVADTVKKITCDEAECNELMAHRRTFPKGVQEYRKELFGANNEAEVNTTNTVTGDIFDRLGVA